jgi:uncharacterized protein (TIGR03437 family)
MSANFSRYRFWCLTAAVWLPCTAWAATFGTVVPIGGQGSDLALDEPRGVLYIANFTANLIEQMSLKDNSIHTSISVAAQPGALALSQDDQYLVIAHYGAWTSAAQSANALTIIHLPDFAQRVFSLSSPPLGVAFGADGQALVVTTTAFLLLNPSTGATSTLGTISDVTAHMLPVQPPNFPTQIVAASMAASGDGWHMYGLTDTFQFSYDVQSHWIGVWAYTSTPTMGPRVLSVNQDGSSYTAGWALFNAPGNMVAQFANPSGALNIGSTVIDSAAGLIYAQIPQAVAAVVSTSTTPPPAVPPAPPVLEIVAADNLTLNQTLQLPENLAGRAVLDSAGAIMYSISDSGVLVMPVGQLQNQHRVQATQEDLVFRGSQCNPGPTVQQLTIVDPSGGHTDFQLTASVPGVSITPSRGTTPATVTVQVDPNAFQSQTGTSVASISIQSSSAVNVPNPVRVLVNNAAPDMRGTFVDVPGVLADVLADPARDRFYVLRQDQNQVLVFDGSTMAQIAILRTSNTPIQMAMSFDNRYLLIGHDNSQMAYVYDLDSLQESAPIVFPFGHYPKSIAASGNAILAACRVAGPVNTIDTVDLFSRTAQTWSSLGIWQNSINVNTMLAASPNGASILAVMADGNVMLYEASGNTFTSSRQDFTALQGAYAASSLNQYVVDDHMLDASLVPIMTVGLDQDPTSGFAFMGRQGLRTMAPASGATGVIERVDVGGGDAISSTHMVEAPLMGSPGAVFTRTLAPLANGNAIISLTTSGFTVLASQYDAAVAPPQITSVVNAGDFSQAMAPGGLISVFGSQLSPVNMATNQLPLPTALGDSCLTVNGTPVPMLFVSPQQINAQLPYNAAGDETLVLYTPGGVSNNYDLTLTSDAPSVFLSGVAGPETGIATVVRTANNQLVTPTNPINPGDQIVIYATGLGATSPPVQAGVPAPSRPLAVVIDTPVVTLGGVALTIGYAGLAPGEVGVYQINAGVPRSVAPGMSVPLTITQSGGATSMNVRVVK